MMKSRKLVVMLVVLCFAVSGCIGSFGLFNKLLTWNKQATGSTWGDEAVFVALTIIPVYGLALASDLLVFNAIEFWGGQNPMSVKVIDQGGHKAVQSFNQDANGKHMTVSYYEGGVLQHTLRLSQASPGTPFIGHVDWTDGRSEDFSVRTVEQGLLSTHTDISGKVESKLLTGGELSRVSLDVERITGAVKTALK